MQIRMNDKPEDHTMKALLKAPFVRRSVRGLTEEDEREIAASLIPEADPAEPELIAAVRGDVLADRKVMLQALPIAAAAMIPGFVVHSAAYCIAVGMSVFGLLIALFIVNVRCQIGEDAVKMNIPVHHTESGMLREYAVCYLPDGKYRIPCERNHPNPATLTVLRSNGQTYCKLNGKDKQS